MKVPAHPPDSNLPTESVSATAAQRTLDAILDRVSRGSVVTITKKGRPVAVLLSPDLYESLSARQTDPLAALRAQFDARFARMQAPEARAGIDALFKAGPKELGIAAVEAAQRQVEAGGDTLSVRMRSRSVQETFLMAKELPDLEDLLRFSKRIASGLPFAELLEVMSTLKLDSTEEWKVAGFSRRSILRRAAQALTPEEGDRLVRLARIGRVALQTLGGPDKVGAWLIRPIRALNWQAPLAFISTNPGAEAVEDVLGRISTGVIS